MTTRRVHGFLLAAVVVTSTLAVAPSPARAAGGVGVPVISFGSCGLSTAHPYVSGSGFGSTAVAVQSDGKLVVAGPADGSVGVYRLLPGGSLDVGFGNNGGTVTDVHDPGTGGTNVAAVSDVLVQPDGRIIVAGANNRPSGGTHFQFVRYQADGRLDTSFGTDGQAVLANLGPVATIALQPDGRLLGAGGRTMVRLDASGRLDPTFASDGILDPAIDGNVRDIVVLPDSRILLGFQPGDDAGFGLARLLPDGTLDASFGAGGIAVAPPLPHPRLRGIAVDSAGRIVSAGSTSAAAEHLALTRHLAGGALDETFGTGGLAEAQFPHAADTPAVGVVVQPDGKPVVAAVIRFRDGPNYLETDIGLTRLTAAGAPDPTFGAGGFTTTRFDDRDAVPNDIEATSDGGVVIVAGRDPGVSQPGAAIVRYRGDVTSSVDNPSVTPQTCAHEATLTPAAAAGYGTHVVHAQPGVRTFTYTNTGPRPVAVSRVGFHEDDGQFVVRSTTCAGARLAPGGSCTVSVAFEPTVAGSYWHTLLVWDDTGRSWQPGSVNGVALATPVGWGWNGLGQLGSGAGPQSLVAGAPSGLGQVASLSAGYHHTLAATESGAVYAWGWNHYGQGGSGCLSTADGCPGAFEPRPVHVPTNFRPADAVAAGGFHNLVLLRDGGVRSWGMNSSGQLGLGHRNAQVVSIDVPGLADVVAVSAGIYHSLALKSDGTVWAWGWNHFGQLGDGTTSDRLVPTRVPGITGVTAIAAGGYHSLALKGDGSVVGWGFNNVGQVGDGTTLDRPSPVTVPGAGAVTRLAGGGFHSLAVIAGGGVSTWGWNAFGQLGDGTIVNRSAPAPVTTGTAVAGGLGHSVALQSDGTVRSWGWNALGQLGDGSITTRTAPVDVPGMLGATLVTAGGLHSLAE